MLIATPETIWSTPKVTVATACIAPPMSPPTSPPTTPSQALPVTWAKSAPNQVPRIIMPSRPMFTTPERSDHKPPSPHKAIGMASVNVAARVPADVMSCAPVTTRTNDTASRARSSTATGPANRVFRSGTRRVTSGVYGDGRNGSWSVDISQPPLRFEASSRLSTRGGAYEPPADSRRFRGPEPASRSCRCARFRRNLARWRRGRGRRSPDDALLATQRDAAHDLVGDHNAQHDHPLGDLHYLLRDVVEIEDQGGLIEEGPEQRGEDNADGAVATEQRDRDAGETEPGREVERILMRVTEQIWHADEPCHGTGDEHSGQHHPLDVDAARLRRGRRNASRTQIEPEPGTGDQEVEPDAHSDREQNQPVHLRIRAWDEAQATDPSRRRDRLRREVVAALGGYRQAGWVEQV